MNTLVRCGVAGVWLVFGLYFKVLGRVPRHRAIVQRVLEAAGLPGRFGAPLTVGIGLGETAMGIWMASGIQTLFCVVVQTALVVAMNLIEIRVAKDLLLFPRTMPVANAVLLGAAYWVAMT